MYYVNPFSGPGTVPLSPDHYIPLTLKRKERISFTSSLFVLDVPEHAVPLENDDGSAIQSLYIMQPEISIQRPYTPLNVEGFKGGELELVVKRYEDGEVSQYLHRRQVGDEVKVRGPVRTWKYDPSLKEIVFVCCRL